MNYLQTINLLCKDAKLPLPEPEYRFAPPRKFRFDFAWAEQMCAIEIEGGIWIKGRHLTPKGYLKDMEKYNLAVILGWRVLRFTPQQIMSGIFLKDIKGLLLASKNNK